VVCEDSTVKAFGENATGQLGNDQTDDSNVPVNVIGLSKIIAVSAGGDQLEAHSMALKSDGTVWCWGSNLYGALGNGLSGTNNSSKVPVQTLALTNVQAISAGGWHSVALKSDSTVWCWGWNQDGQLGDGTNVDKVIPTKVPNLSGIIQISAGRYHTLALKSDRTVWAWGDNAEGQLGNNSTTDSNVPVQVQGLNNVVQISAGRFFSVALKSDGTLWAWGQNLYGQLGDNTTTNRTVPVQVQNLSNVVPGLVATGCFHVIAVKSDNTVWAWGRNTYGNLGTDDVNNRSLPTQMLNISDVAGVEAGTNFTILYKTDGSFWGCGRNASGQLGDGTFTQRNILSLASPVCKILTNSTSYQEKFYSSIPISIYPNPSEKGFFCLDFSEWTLPHDASVNCKILNSLGQIIYHSDVIDLSSDKKIFIEITDKPSGVYYLTLQINEKTFSQKIVKL
ncbi:MAG: T9SS type A sorting domain-containing protein, partial [Bacteroidia bacterium]|nr:T9SS type A sorting domain-containing protein [Bacteroidia bacterium]